LRQTPQRLLFHPFKHAQKKENIYDFHDILAGKKIGHLTDWQAVIAMLWDYKDPAGFGVVVDFVNAVGLPSEYMSSVGKPYYPPMSGRQDGVYTKKMVYQQYYAMWVNYYGIGYQEQYREATAGDFTTIAYI
jgi:hypothetical protein